MAEAPSPLGYAASPLSSLGLYVNRITSSVVGRASELSTAKRELSPDRKSMSCITLEGEPGIGKTRLLFAMEEIARSAGLVPIAVTADEEIRGPFLVARSIFASPAVSEVSEGTPAAKPVAAICDALAQPDDPSLNGLTADRKVVRLFDLAAVALKALAAQRPLVLMVDDFQWADEDSIRMLRYAVRTLAASPITLVISSRSDEVAFVNEAVTLIADMERMGLLHRIKLVRFTQQESTQFLQQVLGGPVNASSAAAMHAQAEGVPFILAEQVSAYRDAGMVQQIDGTWTLARNAEKLLPSAVRTLIQRRAAHFPIDTKENLAEAAILGRAFSLRDLQDLKRRLGELGNDPETLAQTLAPAVASGLLLQNRQGSAADYSFYHDRVREWATATLTPARQRAVHDAIVQMLSVGGAPAPESLPLIAAHAMAGGHPEECAKAAVEAAREALKSHAPEEVLRLVEMAQPVASSAAIRIELLRLQDDALNMLRRPAQRLRSLSQLAALAEASGNPELETEVMLRRAAAFRLSGDYERAAELAERVRAMGAERDDARSELEACLELGQDLLRTEIGETFAPVSSETDMDGAEEAFERAVALGEQLGDERVVAMASRELGVIGTGHIRDWFVDLASRNEHLAIVKRALEGEKLEEILGGYPAAASIFMKTSGVLKRALDIYERLNDRAGSMATIIAMAYITWAPEIHTTGSAKRIEEIRRLATSMKSLTKESERAQAEAQMLYGAHVYSRAKGFPDAALEKGKEAYDAALMLDDRSLEFAASGGLALVNAEIGAVDEAERWLDVASEIALDSPSPSRSRRLASWRGCVRAAANDVDGALDHLQRAVKLATDQGRPAGRCEELAMLAMEAAALGTQLEDERLISIGQQAAEDVRALMPLLPGHPVWGPQADGALARIALHRGDTEAAVDAARSGLQAFMEASNEDLHLELKLPIAEALLAGGTDEERANVLDEMQMTLKMIVSRFVDDRVRVRWLASPTGRDLVRLAKLDLPSLGGPSEAGPMNDEERQLMELLVEGLTNADIAGRLGLTETAVAQKQADVFAKIGATSRADATAAALMGRLV